MRRTALLFLGTMMVLVVGFGGVAVGATYYYCKNTTNCNCEKGTVCIGTAGEDLIHGNDGRPGDTIYAKQGPDSVYPAGGDDYVDGGPGEDYIEGDDAFTSGNDTLLGGDGDDYIEGNKGFDRCYGGGGNDTFHKASCEKIKEY